MTTHTLNGTGRPLTLAVHPLANRERRTAMNRLLRARGIPAKVCSQCLTLKASSAFHRYASAADGLRSYCRTCRAAEHAERQATDPQYRDHRSAVSLAYNAENRDERRAYAKRRNTRIYAANSSKNAARVRDPSVMKRCAGRCGRTLPETEFRLDRRNADGLRIKCRNCADGSRRARRACLDTYGDAPGQACYLCGELIVAEAHADHLVPQSRGGPDTPDNVRWTHNLCNQERGTKPLTPEQLLRARALGPLPSALATTVPGAAS